MASFCITLAIQGALCMLVIVRSEMLVQMQNNAYDLFSQRVASHAQYLENDMVFRWSIVDQVGDDLGSQIGEVLRERGATADDLKVDSTLGIAVVDSLSDSLLDFAQYAEVDGVYVVLANGEASEEGSHTALYVRDSNPQVDVENRSDLMLAVCPISVGRRLDVALDSRWSATFPLAQEGDAQSAFYYEPLRAAELYPDAAANNLGYWGRPVNLGWAGVESVTFSLPLKDEAGNLYGVIGIEVQTDRLSSFFPYQDLDGSGGGSYLLCVTDEEGGYARDGGVAPREGEERAYDVLTTTGAVQSLYVVDDGFSASLDGAGRMVVEASPDHAMADSNASAAATELKLYDGTSPFAHEHWTLAGLMRENDLFSASRELSGSLGTVLVVSLVIGLVVAVLTARLFSSRLRNLMGEVRAVRSERPVSFTTTGIWEVDQLSDAIESLSTEVAASASRLSQILRLSDRSIGAFDYNEETRLVTCTSGFFDAFRGLGPLDGGGVEALESDAPLRIEDFERFIQRYMPYTETESEGRYLVSGPHRVSWVRLVVFPSVEHGRVFGLVEDVTNEIETRRRIEHERDHDVLTGLLNRRAFEQDVTELLEGGNPPKFGAMLMLDLDNLKFINDTYGHDWGDHYIKAAGRAISTVFKGKGVYSRISGDEFLVFVDACEGRAQAEELFTTFLAALESSALEAPDGQTHKVRASMGYACYPEDATDFAHLRAYADFSMYLAKNSRKGALYSFDRKSYEEKSFILNSKEDLNRLLDEGLVEYHFQPIVDARTGMTVAFEALMRPSIPSIPTPDHVIALARSQSKLYRVEHLTFFGALEAYRRCPRIHGVMLFVNSIATQRLSSDDELLLRERFDDLLGNLVIEITESDYSREMALYKEALAHRLDARLAIDDFGSGYNGETSLLDYHVDFVKLDMGIVRDIDTVKDQRDIAKNLIGYAHDRSIGVIAEGVETERELQTVIELGADYVQGYLLGKPAAEPIDIPGNVKRLICELANAQ